VRERETNRQTDRQRERERREKERKRNRKRKRKAKYMLMCAGRCCGHLASGPITINIKGCSKRRTTCMQAMSCICNLPTNWSKVRPVEQLGREI
jgi:hypothetical protein